MSDVTASDQVLQEIRKAISGECSVSLVEPMRSWSDWDAGEVEFRFGDWVIAFFKDADDLDYTSYVMTPEGITIDYDDLTPDPLDRLKDIELQAIEILLMAAK